MRVAQLAYISPSTVLRCYGTASMHIQRVPTTQSDYTRFTHIYTLGCPQRGVISMDPKTAARSCFEAVRPAVIDLSHRIHAHPELGFEEEQASMWLAEMLTD